MTAMQRLDRYWEDYRLEELPADADGAELLGSRRAFYLGAFAAVGVAMRPSPSSCEEKLKLFFGELVKALEALRGTEKEP